jgi:hypothetical protein
MIKRARINQRNPTNRFKYDRGDEVRRTKRIGRQHFDAIWDNKAWRVPAVTNQRSACEIEQEIVTHSETCIRFFN